MSVGPDEVVVTFTSAPGERVTTRVGAHEVVTEGPFHDARVTGLDPDTAYELEVEGVVPDGRWLPAQVRTLVRSRRGRLLATVATANDVHFGETECGKTGDPATDAIGPVLRSAPGEPPYPELMNGAIVDEMLALDPDVVVVKGDLTDTGKAEEYEAFLACYGRLGARMHHVRGNHDAMRDPEMARAGRAVRDRARRRDAGGARHRRARVGRRRARRRAASAGSTTSRAPRRIRCSCSRTTPRSTTDLDYGLIDRRPRRAARRVRPRARTSSATSPGTRTPTTSCVTPRGRDVPFVEVACAKDYPGAWAEYRVHEGGYTQVMRRVAAPDARDWSERARHMIQGIYRDLVLGTIDDRCFTQTF